MAPIIIVPKGYDTKINMFNAQARIDAIESCLLHACMGVTLQPRELPDGNVLGSHMIATVLR